MKATLDKKALATALGIVKNAAGKSTLPILANVLIKPFESSVSFTCTDLDLTLTTKCEATVKEKGNLTVRAALLLNLVRSFPGDTVELQSFKNHLTVKCGESKYDLATLPEDEFPPAAKITDAADFKLPQAGLRSLLATTGFPGDAADESRYVLNGSLFQLNGELTIASTDGRRLAVSSGAFDTPESGSTRAPRVLPDAPSGKSGKSLDSIVPKAATHALLALLDDSPSPGGEGRGEGGKKTIVKVSIGKNAARFEFGDVTLTTKLIEGNYPNYKQIIPNLSESKGVPIGRADLLQAVQRVALIAESCKLEFRQQLLTISGASESKDAFGRATECLMVPKCPDIGAKFNVRYLTEALSAIDDDEVIFHHVGNLSVFKVKDKPWLCVIAGLIESKEAGKGAPISESASSKTTPETETESQPVAA